VHPHLTATRRQLLATGALLLTGAARAQTDTDFWTLLRGGGCVLLMRHAQTEPGIGDPPGFRLGDCSTQRNLSEAGREQARRVGRTFARQGIAISEVRSSGWCRCIDTAQLAFGAHTVWPAIHSFFQEGDGSRQTQAVLQAVAGLGAPRNLALVTHQVNISALTGAFPAMGEIFVTRPDPSSAQRLPVLARLVV